jgi:hypothetical protein
VAEQVKTAVVTGGHSYDVPEFHELFRGLAGVDAYIQHLEDFASSPQEVRDGYGAVLFFFFPQENPSDEGMPWFLGKPKTAMEHLGETGQGIVVLHHAILAYPHWPVWAELCGISDSSFSYFPNQHIRVEVARPDHPIVHGLSDWEMVDETYKMQDAGPGSEVLLTVDDPKSMHTVAWTRTHKRSRVFCCGLGHDNQAWSAPNFQEMLRRGILWVARRL